MDLIESDLIFSFSEKDWEVIKYDTHRYYKILSGVGLKGIDFLGVFNKRKVVFFEVKNYRNQHLSKKNGYLVLENPTNFVQQVAQKLKDTLKAVEVIIQYLERKGWYRFYLRFHTWIPPFIVQKKDWYFWHRLYQLMQEKEGMEFVLWLEIEDEIPLVKRGELLEELKKSLSGILRKIAIAHLGNGVFEDSLRVKSLT